MEKPSVILVRRLALLCACAALAAAGACARKTVLLEYRFTRGDELRYRMTLKGGGTMSMAGLPGQKPGLEAPLKLETELEYRMLVRDVDDKGNADVEIFFERFSSLSDSGAMRIRTEADAKGARIVQGETVIRDAPGLEGLKALFMTPSILKMSRRGKVLSVAEPGGVGALLPNTDVFALLRQNEFVLPEGPIAVGGAWTEKRSVMLGAGIADKLPGAKPLLLDTRYTLAGVAAREGRTAAEITQSGVMEAKNLEMASPKTAEGGAAMTIVFDRIRQGTAGGVRFDVDRGCLIDMRSDLEQDIAMTMKLPQGGAEVKFSTVTKMKLAAELKLVE